MSSKLQLKNVPLSGWLIWIIYLVLSVIMGWVFLQPFWAERHYRNGFNDTMRKRYKFAIEDLTLATTYAPWEVHYQAQLGKTYSLYADHVSDTTQKIELVNKALSIFQDIIKFDNNNPWYYNRIALFYQKLGLLIPEKKEDYVKQIHFHTKKAMMVDQKNPIFVLNYAILLHQLGRTDEAIPLYEKVISYDDNIPEPYYNLGEIYITKQDPNKALTYYLSLFKKNPNYGKTSLAIANLYIQSNNPQEAIPFLEHAQQTNTINKDSLVSLAALYYQTKQWSKAAETYKGLLKDPQNNGLRPYYLQSLLNAGQIQETLNHLQMLIKQYPDNKHYQYQFNTITNQLNKHKK